MCMEELRKPRISFVISQNVHGGAQEVKNIVCNIPECARRSSGSQEYYYPRILLSQNVQGGAQEARNIILISQNVHGGAQEAKNIVCNIPECARRSSESQEYYYPRILLSQNVQGGAQEARNIVLISQNVHGGAQEAKNIVCNIPECARRSSGS